MKPLTNEWITKAEGDYNTARREVSAPDYPNYDAACFHAQQCVEKYLKARLVEEGIDFAKTHDLGAILNLIIPIEPDWENLRPELDSLTDRSVEVRYPGCFADATDAAEAVVIAGKVRKIVRKALHLPLSS